MIMGINTTKQAERRPTDSPKFLLANRYVKTTVQASKKALGTRVNKILFLDKNLREIVAVVMAPYH